MTVQQRNAVMDCVRHAQPMARNGDAAKARACRTVMKCKPAAARDLRGHGPCTQQMRARRQSGQRSKSDYAKPSDCACDNGPLNQKLYAA
jgi:hypothetical protein